MSTVRLGFSPATAHVRTARLVAVAVARRAGVPEDLLDEVRLAVGEACSRAVALHRRHRRHDLIEVAMTDGERFTVRVRDHAPAGAWPGSAVPDPAALVSHATAAVPHRNPSGPGAPAIPGTSGAPGPAGGSGTAGSPEDHNPSRAQVTPNGPSPVHDQIVRPGTDQVNATNQPATPHLGDVDEFSAADALAE